MLTLLQGVIILSAVLKRRMMLADKAKSLFISKCVALSFACECRANVFASQYFARAENTIARSELDCHVLLRTRLTLPRSLPQRNCYRTRLWISIRPRFCKLFRRAGRRSWKLSITSLISQS